MNVNILERDLGEVSIVVPLRYVFHIEVRQKESFFVWMFSQYHIIADRQLRTYFLEEFYFRVFYAVVSLYRLNRKRHQEQLVFFV